MKDCSLHKGLRQTVEQFGHAILLENRLINILLDYGAFSDVPGSKTIIQAMIVGGYCQKILDLGKQKSSIFSSLLNRNVPIIKPEQEGGQSILKSYVDSISKQNGFQIQLVNYVVQSILYGLNWIDDIPEIPASQSSAAIQSNSRVPKPMSFNRETTSGKNTNKTNSVTYNNITSTQFLVMRVFPLNALVYIDGQQQFVSNGVMAVELPVGQHTYEVRADSYEAKRGSIVINDYEKAEVDVQLKLEKKFVKLTIEAEDRDADILINGEIYGKGSWEGLVEEGNYDIEVSKFRYYPYQQSIAIIGIDKQKISVPLLNPICGNLKVNVQPYGSSIHMDDGFKGETPLLVKHILIGERNLTIRTKEGTSYKTTVEIKENQTTDVEHIIPTLFLYDYSNVRLGDYFYEDGSFSHVKASGKKMVGVVFNLNPSEEEKKNGWIHGQIIALKDAKIDRNTSSTWGVPTQELLDLSIDNPNNKKNLIDNGYLITHLNSVVNNPDFHPFIVAEQHEDGLPFGITSGWYLPCIAQWRTLEDFYRNYYKDKWNFWEVSKFFKLTENGLGRYASCSICNSGTAWKYFFGYREEMLSQAFQKTSIMNYGWDKVRAVASF